MFPSAGWACGSGDVFVCNWINPLTEQEQAYSILEEIPGFGSRLFRSLESGGITIYPVVVFPPRIPPRKSTYEH